MKYISTRNNYSFITDFRKSIIKRVSIGFEAFTCPKIGLMMKTNLAKKKLFENIEKLLLNL